MRLVALLVAFLFVAVRGEADIVGAVATYKVGSDLITEARQTAGALIGQAEGSGNALIMRNANELNVLAANVSMLLGSELNETMGQMSVENRALMNALALAIKAAQETAASATYSLRDAVALDLRGVVASTGVGEQFYVQRITGLTQLQRNSGEYRIAITGLGLGIPTDKRRATVQLLIDGKTSSRVTAVKPDAYTTVFTIPNDVLAPHFADRKMAVARAAFDISYDYKSGLIFSRWKNLQQRIPVRLALMPAYAGTISVTALTQVREWVFLRTETQHRTTANHHCEKKCNGEPTRTNYTMTIKVPSTDRGEPGDQKLTSPRIRCVTQIVNFPGLEAIGVSSSMDVSSCAWSAINSSALSEGDTRATASFDVWSKPTNWVFEADVHEYRTVREERSTKNYDLYFGRLVDIEVPKSTTIAKISGKMITNATFELVAGKNDAQSLMKLESEIVSDLNRKFIYLVNRPAVD